MLGLVIEQPDHGFSLERRLAERFASARFAYSTAYSAVGRLRERRARTCGASRSERGGYGRGRLRGDAGGRRALPHWVRAPTSAPVLREELHARIALCEPRDLPRLIDVDLHGGTARASPSSTASASGWSPSRAAPSAAPLAEEEWSELMEDGVAARRSGHLGRADHAARTAAQLSGGVARGGRAARALRASACARGGSADGMSELLRLTDVARATAVARRSCACCARREPGGRESARSSACWRTHGAGQDDAAADRRGDGERRRGRCLL